MSDTSDTNCIQTDSELCKALRQCILPTHYTTGVFYDRQRETMCWLVTVCGWTVCLLLLVLLNSWHCRPPLEHLKSEKYLGRQCGTFTEGVWWGEGIHLWRSLLEEVFWCGLKGISLFERVSSKRICSGKQAGISFPLKPFLKPFNQPENKTRHPADRLQVMPCDRHEEYSTLSAINEVPAVSLPLH